MTSKLWRGASLDDMTLSVEVAWGADLTDTDGSGWTWTDITADVRQDPGISTRLGRGDEAARSQPAELNLVLDNSASAYSLGGHSPNYPYVRRGAPVRVRVNPNDGSGFRVAFLGYATGWTPDWDAAGAIPVVALSASGTLRRLAQGSAPVLSAYRRSMIDTASVVAYWPMEEQSGATSSPAVRGGTTMGQSLSDQVEWATSSVFESSAPLPQVGTSSLTAVVTPYTATGENQVRFFLVVPEAGLANGSVLAYVSTTGTLGRWDIIYDSGGTGNLSIFIYNSDGTLNSSTVGVTFDMNGNRRRLELQLTESGGSVNWWLGVLDANPGDSGGGTSGTIASRTVGIVSQVQLSPLGQCDGAVFGHLTVQNDVTSTFEAAQAFWAWQRRTGTLLFPEVASVSTASASRMTRLLTENKIEVTRYAGSLSSDLVNTTEEGLGPQRVRTLLDLLYECEDVDQGQLWDGRTVGLAYTTRRYREDGVTVLTIDASSDQLAGPFQAVDDDQRTVNKATATRSTGASAVYEDTTGPMGTQVIGIYDTSIEFNGFSDNQAVQQAAWAVSLGTVQGYRYPTLTVDLRSTPGLAGRVLDLVPGDRITITNADHALTGFRPGDVLLIIEGIAHQIDAAGWQATFTCSWAEPWLVGRTGSDSGDTSEFLWRVDTGGSSLAASAPRNSTTLSVSTPSGPLWSTVADDYPVQLDVGGIAVRATACSGSSSPQTFTVDPLPLDRVSGSAVKLWAQRPLGFGRSTT